jgi:glucokinase-like ROK family protein
MELNHSAGKPELLKEINRSLVFDILQSARSISRPELADKTGLSRATISILSEELLKTGLVRDAGLGLSSGGRRPAILEFDPDAACALGACIQADTWRIVLTDLDARVLKSDTMPIPDRSPEAVIATLEECVSRIACDIDNAKLLPAIGLGTPGLVDMRSGTVKTAADFNWIDIPFREMALQALGFKTAYVANRSRVGALAEFWHGVGQGLNDLIYISIGTGVAAGIVHDGRLYEGTNSSAGELGHITILPDGPVCPCGNHGCLQQLVSADAIANRARKMLRSESRSVLHSVAEGHPEHITVWDVFHAAEMGDEPALALMRETASFLAIAIANLINLFNPELIVLGGPVGRSSQLLKEMIEERVGLRAMMYPLSVARIVRSSLGAEAGSIGASVLVLQHANELFFRRSSGEPANGSAR